MKTLSVTAKSLLFTLLLFPLQILSSQKIDDIFSRSGAPIVWLGLDFTQVRLVGGLGTVDKDELIPLFESINRVIVSERTKYNFASALRRDEIPYDLEVVTRLNEAMDPSKAIAYTSSDERGRLSEETISVLVKQYKLEKQEGIGLVFFVETLDKVKEKGIMWVTFFNLADRNILFTEKMAGTAGGISFRNHWARCAYEIINQIRENRYAEWRFRYVR